MRICFERVEAELASRRATRALARLKTAAETTRGPYEFATLLDHPAQSLELRRGVLSDASAQTRKRIEEASDAGGVDRHWGRLAFWRRRDLPLEQALALIRCDVLGLPAAYRTGDVHAPLGRTGYAAQFPPAESVPRDLLQLANVRTAQPFAESIWNALLLYLLLLRVHPYADGNGRAARALLGVDLFRAGLLDDPNLPLKRTLDVNRATEMRLAVKVSRSAQCSLRTASAVSEYMCFVADLVRRTIELAGRTP